MFDFLGRLAVARPRFICAAWLLTAIVLTCLAPSWSRHAQDDDIHFLPADLPSVRGFSLLEQSFRDDVSASRLLFAVERPDGPLTPADLQLVDRLAADLHQLQQDELSAQIRNVVTYKDGPVGSRLTSTDKHCTLIQVALTTPYLALQTRATVDRAEACVQRRLAETDVHGLHVHTTGPAGVGRDLVAASARSLDHTTWATVVLVIAVLLLVYRSPLLALVPLLTIGIATWVALSLLSLATLIPGVHLVNISQVFAIVMLFGAGTDYCLFLISRYREELEAGQSTPVGVQRGTRAVGGALAASAGTVICGLGMMGFAEFGKIRCAGPVIALGLVVALVASLTLTPALLRLFGRMAFWPQRQLLALPGRARAGLWNRVAGLVVRRPLLIWLGALAVLAPPAVVGILIKPTFRPIGDLGPASGSVRGMGVIQAHYTAGETGPITVLLAAPVDWDGRAGRDLIDHLSRGFAKLENVGEVRSLTQPLGQPLTDPSAASSLLPAWMRKNVQAAYEKGRAQAKKHYVRPLTEAWSVERGARSEGSSSRSTLRAPRSALQVTRLDVVTKSDPFDPASIATLELIETWLAHNLPAERVAGQSVRAEVVGMTVHTRDLAGVIARDRYRVNVLVLGGVLLILIALVRRVWLALYLLGTVLLSYYATLGMTAVWAWAVSGREFGQIEWRVPFFLFTILVAVGEDYNILLVTRILQERKRLGVVEGMRRALARTGGTISACGLIMAGTFGTLMLARLDTLAQIGFALAFGVILDTFLIRPFLVPAFMLLVWQGRARREQRRSPGLRSRGPLREAA